MRPLVLLLAVLQILSAVADAKQEPLEEPAETPAAAVSLQLVSRFQNQVEVTEQAGALSITTTGNDPYIEFDLRASLPNAIADAPQELGKLNVLAFEYFSAAGIHGIEVRLRDRGDWQPVIDSGSLLAAQGWSQGQLRLVDSDNNFWSEGQPQILRIDFGQEADRSISLRDIKLRKPTQAERDLEQRAAAEWAEKLSLAETWQKYLSPQMPQAIERVAVEEQSIALEIAASSAGQGVMLAELEPHQSSAIAGPRRIVADLQRRTEADNGEPLRFQFPRRLDGYDRLQSRWQLVTATADAGIYAPASTAAYATQLSVLDRELSPPPALRNAKGLGGVSPVFGLEELVELGVQHITVNLVITDLIEPVIETSSGTPARQATVSSDETFEYAGRRWKLRTGRLHHVDQTVAFASQYNIVVAAIVLLPQRSSDSIVHPDSTSSGIYAMPNLTDREGALKYAAVMHVLAQRYSGQQLGRIDHWIMHNEVDFGWVWTNMGQQPLALFMDHYVRSMRIAALETRQANPHAQVFISLTHHWNVPDDPRGRTYSPRRQLDWLAASSSVVALGTYDKCWTSPSLLVTGNWIQRNPHHVATIGHVQAAFHSNTSRPTSSPKSVSPCSCDGLQFLSRSRRLSFSLFSGRTTNSPFRTVSSTCAPSVTSNCPARTAGILTARLLPHR